MSEKTIRCTRCAAEFTEEDLKDASDCPKCGEQGCPCIISDDVAIKINWHELRILGIWATNWANKQGFDIGAKKTLAAILSRIEKQYPRKEPLTLAGEIKRLQEIFPTTEIYDEDGQLISPRKILN
jgi:hypothetical protein